MLQINAQRAAQTLADLLLRRNDLSSEEVSIKHDRLIARELIRDQHVTGKTELKFDEFYEKNCDGLTYKPLFGSGTIVAQCRESFGKWHNLFRLTVVRFDNTVRAATLYFDDNVSVRIRLEKRQDGTWVGTDRLALAAGPLMEHLFPHE